MTERPHVCGEGGSNVKILSPSLGLDGTKQIQVDCIPLTNRPTLGQLFANSWVILFLRQLSHLVDIDIPGSYNYQGPKVGPRLPSHFHH